MLFAFDFPLACFRARFPSSIATGFGLRIAKFRSLPVQEVHFPCTFFYFLLPPSDPFKLLAPMFYRPSLYAPPSVFSFFCGLCDSTFLLMHPAAPLDFLIRFEEVSRLIFFLAGLENSYPCLRRAPFQPPVCLSSPFVLIGKGH